MEIQTPDPWGEWPQNPVRENLTRAEGGLKGGSRRNMRATLDDDRRTLAKKVMPAI
jgi:hypothetical protein